MFYERKWEGKSTFTQNVPQPELNSEERQWNLRLSIVHLRPMYLTLISITFKWNTSIKLIGWKLSIFQRGKMMRSQYFSTVRIANTIKLARDLLIGILYSITFMSHGYNWSNQPNIVIVHFSTAANVIVEIRLRIVNGFKWFFLPLILIYLKTYEVQCF